MKTNLRALKGFPKLTDLQYFLLPLVTLLAPSKMPGGLLAHRQQPQIPLDCSPVCLCTSQRLNLNLKSFFPSILYTSQLLLPPCLKGTGLVFSSI